MFALMELGALAESWRRRNEQQQEARLHLADGVPAAARTGAAVLRHDAFDVDLAVRGLPRERYFSALSRVSDVVGRTVDLVPLLEGMQAVSPERWRQLDAFVETLAALAEQLDE
ncbi:hypothetical protein ACFL6X_03790 [Candidatus Latescibacterota bacterium]